MPAQLTKNNAFSALAAGITNIATTMTVAGGTGDRFPIVTGSDWCFLTLQDASNNIEIIKVTARASASDSMTIARGQEGTTARAWNSGDIVELRLTAGTTVTIDGAQTLTNKTIALGSNTVSGTKAQFNTALTDADFIFSDDAKVTADQAAGTASIRTLGTSSTSAAAGNHAHGNITNLGAIGTTADLPLKTTTSGVIHAASWSASSAALGVSSPGSAVTFARGDHVHAMVTSQAGAAGSIGTVNISGTSIGVSLGTTSTTAAAGDHTHSAYAASSHAHGNITNAGAIGATSGLPIITTTSGVLTAGSWGSSAGTFCQGNDSRLSDARPANGGTSAACSGNSATATTATSAVSVTGTTTAAVPTSALGSGTASSSTYLRGDRTFATLPASGVPTDVGAQAVGSFALLTNGGTQFDAGGTYSGASLKIVSFFSGGDLGYVMLSVGSTVSGTWRAMSNSIANTYRIGLFQRIS